MRTIDENIINDLSDPCLMDAADKMLVESVLCWGKWDKMEIEELDDCTITKSDIDFPFFNCVLSPRFSENNVEARLQEAIEKVSRGTNNVSIWLGQHYKPENLQEKLEKAGAVKIANPLIMAAELEDLEGVNLPRGLEIVEVTNREQLEQWTSVVVPAHQIPENIAIHWTDMYESAGYGPNDSLNRHFIAVLHGEVVGATTLITASGIASVANVSTREDKRKNGIGSAMTIWPLKVAQDEGYKVACISASPDGQPVYERLGFKGLRNVAVYLSAPQ